MKSWKTTVAGVGAILAAIGPALKAVFDGDPSTNPDWAMVAASVTAGFGLIFAKDFDKTGTPQSK